VDLFGLRGGTSEESLPRARHVNERAGEKEKRREAGASKIHLAHSGEGNRIGLKKKKKKRFRKR